MSVWSHDFGTTRDPARRWAFDKMLRNSTDLRYIDRCMQPDTSEPFRLAAVRVMGPCRSERVTQALTVNHDHERRVHVTHLYTDAAPSMPLHLRPRAERFPRLPLRRRVDWCRVAGIAACAVSAVAFVGTFAGIAWYVLSH